MSFKEFLLTQKPPTTNVVNYKSIYGMVEGHLQPNMFGIQKEKVFIYNLM